MKVTDVGVSFAETAAFEKDLKAEVVGLTKLTDVGDSVAEHELGAEIASCLLSRHPVEVAAILMSTMIDLVRAEAKIKDLEASIESMANPGQLPDNEATRKIDYFLAHPETGVRRESPARRGMSGVQIGDGGTQSNVFYENGK